MDNKQLALMITKALAYAENNGKPTAPQAGKTGEMKSIFQFTPDTWKLYSKQILGKEAPLDTQTESQVTYGKVQKWVDDLKSQGVSDDEIPLKIGSMWNAGEHKPDAYKENWKGTNKKYGIAYDTPEYAKKVKGYVDQFTKEDTNHPMMKSITANSTAPMMSNSQNQNVQAPNDMASLVNTATLNTKGGLLGFLKPSV